MNLPFVILRHGDDRVIALAGVDEYEGLIGVDVMHDRVVSYDVDDIVGAVSIDPASVYFGVDVMWKESEMRRAAEASAKVRKFAPRGFKFVPLFSPEPFGLPISGFPEVQSQLRRHRDETPSVETIRMSAASKF